MFLLPSHFRLPFSFFMFLHTYEQILWLNFNRPFSIFFSPLDSPLSLWLFIAVARVYSQCRETVFSKINIYLWSVLLPLSTDYYARARKFYIESIEILIQINQFTDEPTLRRSGLLSPTLFLLWLETVRRLKSVGSNQRLIEDHAEQECLYVPRTVTPRAVRFSRANHLLVWLEQNSGIVFVIFDDTPTLFVLVERTRRWAISPIAPSEKTDGCPRRLLNSACFASMAYPPSSRTNRSGSRTVIHAELSKLSHAKH